MIFEDYVLKNEITKNNDSFRTETQRTREWLSYKFKKEEEKRLNLPKFKWKIVQVHIQNGFVKNFQLDLKHSKTVSGMTQQYFFFKNRDFWRIFRRNYLVYPEEEKHI